MREKLSEVLEHYSTLQSLPHLLRPFTLLALNCHSFSQVVNVPYSGASAC